MKVTKRTIGMFLSRFGIAMAPGKDDGTLPHVGFLEDMPEPRKDDDIHRLLEYFELGGEQKFNRIGDLAAFHYETNSITVNLDDNGGVQKIKVNDKLALKIYTVVAGRYIWPRTVTFQQFYDQARTQLCTFNRYVKSGVPMRHSDIFHYSSWKELRDDMMKAELHSSKRSTKRLTKATGIKCVISNSKMKVFHVLTYEGACIIGKGTRWCISGTGDAKYQATWNRYNNHSAIFVVVEKNRKTAVVAGWQPDSIKIYNEADKEVSISDMEREWDIGARQLMKEGGIEPPQCAKPAILRPHAGFAEGESVAVGRLRDNLSFSSCT